ncbi:MAG: PAS domain S-box protein [Deltaproteobacteria bacterium]|nr:PAS domain S-box protein [Deltaproteobacteria bacterium]
MKDENKTRFQLINELQDMRKRLSDFEENEERLDLALYAANSGLWDWRPYENTVFFDDRYYIMAGYEPNEFPASFEEWEKRVHPDDIEPVRNNIETCRTGKGDTYDAEFRFLRKDGGYMWILAKGKVISRDNAGNIIRFIGIHSDVTDRKIAEESLRESEEKFRLYLENSHGGVIIVDADRKIEYANSVLSKILDYPLDEIVGRQFIHFLAEENRALAIDYSNRRQKGEEVPLKYETNIIRKNGEKRNAELSAAVTIDSKGNPKTIAQLLDITERKRAEESLRENLIQLQAIYNSLPVIVWSMDEKGVFTLSEGKELASIGLRPGQVVGKSYFDFHKDNQQVFEKANIALAGESCEYESKVMGNIYHSFLTPVFDENNAVRGVNALAINITEKRRVEEELRHLRNYLSNIINSMPSALVGVDTQGRVTQWNKTVERMTGISADAARGRTLVGMLPQMALEMEKIRKSIRTRQVMREQKRPRPSEDGICYEDVTIYPVVTNGVEGAVIRIDDVTERVRLEEMMIQSEKMLSVGGLAAGMAHEINNPLAGMMQTADVIAGRLGDNLHIPANQRAAEAAGTTLKAIERFMTARGIPRMLATINVSGKRVAAIVDNMLSFARKSEATVSSHALNDLLDKTLELAATDYDSKKQYDFKRIEIEKDYGADLPTVSCEGAKIQQVLLNIFRNGAQAMQEAGAENPRFTVRTCFEKMRNMVCMEIGDNGPGMDEETRRRVFEPFFTTKSAGEGTGLGLSVSYFIITENHRGEMAVESRPGSGTRFVIRLPMKGAQN